MKLFSFFSRKQTESKSNKKKTMNPHLENLDILGEMLLVFFDDKTKELVKNQFESRNQKIPLDTHDMNFRLYLSNNGSINLELLAQNNLGMYFKPIGFYEMMNGDLQLTILKEFEDTYHKYFRDETNVKFLSLKENAFIAAGSSDVASAVKGMFGSPKYDRHMPPSIENFQSENILSNGLNINIRTSMMGALETNLDDEKYEIDDSLLIMYQNNNGISLHATDSEYTDMMDRELLSAFKSF